MYCTYEDSIFRRHTGEQKNMKILLWFNTKKQKNKKNI